jgi:hypothetical protein
MRYWIVTIAAGVLAWLVWQELIRPNIIPKNFGVVAEGKVFRSGELTPGAMRRVVEKYGVKTVVDLGAYETGSEGERRQQRTADVLGVARYKFDLEGDGTGNPNAYVLALRLMTDSSKQPVLVHCSAGSERTGVLTALYRNIVEGKSVAEALPEAREHRHDPGRNPWLLVVLADWRDRIAQAYRSGRQIPGIEALPEPKPVAASGQ